MHCTFESTLLPVALVLNICLEREFRLVREVCKTLDTSQFWLEWRTLTINRYVEQSQKVSPFRLDEREHPGAELLNLLESRIERHIYDEYETAQPLLPTK